jgi:hypothetical protein
MTFANHLHDRRTQRLAKHNLILLEVPAANLTGHVLVSRRSGMEVHKEMTEAFSNHN